MIVQTTALREERQTGKETWAGIKSGYFETGGWGIREREMEKERETHEQRHKETDLERGRERLRKRMI